MPKHLAKLSKFGGQFRLTIPKLLIQEMGWKDAEYVILQANDVRYITVRRFIDGESLKSKDARDRTGSD